MGSRAPRHDVAIHPDEHREDDLPGAPAAMGRSRSTAVLQRIAAQLDIPTSALLDLPNAVTGKAGSDAPVDTLHRDCLEMVRAFSRVGDPEERRRLLALVQRAADRA